MILQVGSMQCSGRSIMLSEELPATLNFSYSGQLNASCLIMVPHPPYLQLVI